MDLGDCTICITVPCANRVFSGRNGIGTPRQRGDCATVSGLSFTGPKPNPKPPPPPGPPPRPPRPSGCAPATSGGILPSGGSITIDVRLPAFRTELKTAL